MNRNNFHLIAICWHSKLLTLTHTKRTDGRMGRREIRITVAGTLLVGASPHPRPKRTVLSILSSCMLSYSIIISHPHQQSRLLHDREQKYPLGKEASAETAISLNFCMLRTNKVCLYEEEVETSVWTYPQSCCFFVAAVMFIRLRNRQAKKELFKSIWALEKFINY